MSRSNKRQFSRQIPVSPHVLNACLDRLHDVLQGIDLYYVSLLHSHFLFCFL